MTNTPVRIQKVRTLNRVKTIGMAVIASLLVGAVPAVAGQPANTGRALVLSCRASTSPKAPVKFSPALTLQRRATRITGTFLLRGCTSPNGSQRRLRSARVELIGSARADCTGADRITGTSTIIWYDSEGRSIGASTGHTSQRSVKGYNPGEALLGGVVGHGVLAGARSSGTATPTSNVIQCTTQGLKSLHARGTVHFWK